MKRLFAIIGACCVLPIVIIGIFWFASNKPANQTTQPESGDNRVINVDKATLAQAKPFSVEEKRGQVISFSKETIKKSTLLVFWAAWCPHCQRELPIIEEVWGELKDQIDIIAIRVFYDSQKQSIIDDDNFSFPIALNGQSVGDLYKITSIPTLVFVDKDFNMRERIEGELPKDELLQKINNLKIPIENFGVKEGTSVGNQFPNFKVADVDGRTITNQTLKGKPAIIWFTTSWCVPCQIGAKMVAKLDNELGGKSFEVLVIFVDPKESNEDLINWRKQFANSDWMVAFDNELTQLAARINLKFLDSKFILDKNGVIQNVDFKIADENYLNTIREIVKANQ